ncbi:MAG: histidinol dehydrogenase [Ruminiclostridium sp.]|jgi:histidinol dehydrogenase|nr:histidinol dehydrogenase [Ruminiclostridium sp.]
MIPIYQENQVTEIFSRQDPVNDAAQEVRAILEQVKTRGDAALKAYTKTFDGAELSTIEVDAWTVDEGFRRADPVLVEILYRAAERISAFHQNQLRSGFQTSGERGIILGQKVLPLERVGLYVPGGTAAYPSSVLMNAIPAKLAGVKELCMVTPPGKDGKIAPNILAAARICGVDRVFRVGGAQAVAALAYGTESIPRVDKIVGPGNRFVAEAKRQVFGKVGIDMVAGPSEILVIADGASNPQHVAADLLSQAEHDTAAAAVLITDSAPLAEAVQKAIEAQLPTLKREEIARASIDGNGKIIVTESLDSAIRIANEIAPEHLELCVEDPFRYLNDVKNAGSIFLGRSCPEALGDYFAGPNHTLPTGGTARFSSPLSVDDFVKKSQYIYYTPEALSVARESVSNFAKKEGLTGHARSVDIRFDPVGGES